MITRMVIRFFLFEFICEWEASQRIITIKRKDQNLLFLLKAIFKILGYLTVCVLTTNDTSCHTQLLTSSYHFQHVTDAKNHHSTCLTHLDNSFFKIYSWFPIHSETTRFLYLTLCRVYDCTLECKYANSRAQFEAASRQHRPDRLRQTRRMSKVGIASGRTYHLPDIWHTAYRYFIVQPTLHTTTVLRQRTYLCRAIYIQVSSPHHCSVDSTTGFLLRSHGVVF